jgi:hypothetical protein
VLVSDLMLSRGVWLPCTSIDDTVGDRVVNGRWNDDDQVLGVPGTYGKGYEGVRRAAWAGVGGTLPLIVLDDSVDSVDVVWALVGSGLLNDASNDGEIIRGGSSLMGEILRAPRL